MKESEITLEHVEMEIRYDPLSGEFIRLRTGKVAGSVDQWGHRQIRICGRLTMAHRLAWLWMTGKWPEGRLDHRDGNPDNNKWENLRIATPSQNAMNSRLRSDNKSQLKGVSLHTCGKWVAKAGNKYLGLYSSPEDAYAARLKVVGESHGEFFRER